jgi:hypothetical protein
MSMATLRRTSRTTLQRRFVHRIGQVLHEPSEVRFVTRHALTIFLLHHLAAQQGFSDAMLLLSQNDQGLGSF